MLIVAFMRRAYLLLSLCAAGVAAEPKMLLRQGWSIHFLADVRESGAVLSTPAYAPYNWYSATLPSTVLSALVHAAALF